MNSLISPDDHWLIWTFLVGMAAVSIMLEKRHEFAKKVTGAAIAVVFGMIASSTGLMPTASVSYDVVWEYIVPLSIPLLLMKINVFTIFRETGRLMGAFHIASLGTIIGTFVAVYFLHKFIDDLNLIAPAMTGSYIGGGVNFVALVSTFNPPADLVNTTIVADSGVMIIYFLLLILLPASAFFRRFYPRTVKTISVTGEQEGGTKEDYWQPNQISLSDIAKAMAIAFVISGSSTKISGFFNGEGMPEIVRSILGQKFLVLTTLSVIFPFLFPKTAKSINGNNELGTFLIYVFFVAIGLPASIKAVIFGAPLMVLFCAIILLFNFLTTLLLGKIFKFELEEMVLACVTTAGGPMNGVAIAISKQWPKLIIPSMMVGIWGYIIGTYIGYLTGLLLK